MVALIESVAAKCVVQELPGITQSHVVEPPKKEGASKNFSIVTEGANLGVHVMRSSVDVPDKVPDTHSPGRTRCTLPDLFTLWQVNRQKNIDGALDLTRVSCNDISQIRRVLGVEAARKTLYDEISGVFRCILLIRRLCVEECCSLLGIWGGGTWFSEVFSAALLRSMCALLQQALHGLILHGDQRLRYWSRLASHIAHIRLHDVLGRPPPHEPHR